MPKLLWYHQNTLVKEQDHIYTRIHESTNSEYHGCLQLVNPTHIYNGEYKLVARNEYGEDQKKVLAVFINPPYDGHSGDWSCGFVIVVVVLVGMFCFVVCY